MSGIVHLHMGGITTQTQASQPESFTLEAKKRLLETGSNITLLARKLQLHRNTVSGAINKPHLFRDTQIRIRKALKLPIA